MGRLLNCNSLPQVDKGLGRRLLGNAECPENTFLACQRFYEIIADFNTNSFLPNINGPYATQFIL